MAKRMIAEHVGASAQTGSPVERLTDRELEVLQLIGEGNEVKGIASKFHLSAKTVEAHRAHIKEKLNLSNAREVARFAVRWVDQQR